MKMLSKLAGCRLPYQTTDFEEIDALWALREAGHIQCQLPRLMEDAINTAIEYEAIVFEVTVLGRLMLQHFGRSSVVPRLRGKDSNG